MEGTGSSRPPAVLVDASVERSPTLIGGWSSHPTAHKWGISTSRSGEENVSAVKTLIELPVSLRHLAPSLMVARAQFGAPLRRASGSVGGWGRGGGRTMQILASVL